MKLRPTLTTCAVIALTLLAFALVYQSSLNPLKSPDIPPPPGSMTVYFHRYAGWQTLRYYYHLENEPTGCIEFAKTLMRTHLGDGITITEEPFKQFPVSGNFPWWFNPDRITNGVLLSGDNRIFAAVDSTVGRMYYYFGH
ncbi:MAG TPA: hypothetical protein PKE26_16995 [Kiritimatiellia bacterium]|nr:hypothetical protein [Kiritimatiellia bacterium]